MSLSPAFADGRTIVFASDEAYAPILGVAFQSLLDHAAPRHLYEVIVLWPDGRGSSAPPAPAQEALARQAAGRENVRLRFFDMGAWWAGRGGAVELPVGQGDHVSVATYYRLFLPAILERYRRAVYLDADLILQADAAELWAEDLGGAALGAVRDVWAVKVLRAPYGRFLDWAATLGLAEPDGYFNAGVLVLDLDRMRRDRVEERCLERLKLFPPFQHDQDLLNYACQGAKALLHPAWNSQAWWGQVHGNPAVAETLPPDLLREYRAGAERPRIIHYLNRRKPWQAGWRDQPLAAPFWETARRTPFRELLEEWAAG